MSEAKADRPDLEALDHLAQQFEGTWCAMPNDCIGGWCVMPGPEPPSSGTIEIATFCQREAAEFIALVRNMLPGLIAEIHRLEADNAAWRQTILDSPADCPGCGTYLPSPLHHLECPIRALLEGESGRVILNQFAALEADNAALRQQLAMAAERIAAQSELLARKAEAAS